MKAYQLTHDGFLVAEIECRESPLEPGKHLVPGGCVETAPPKKLKKNHRFHWDGSAWEQVPVQEGSEDA